MILLASNRFWNPAHYSLDKDDKRFLKEKALSGVEIVDGAARLCAMNLFLHGIGGEDSVAVRDALSSEGSAEYDKPDEKLGSLKSLERLIANLTDESFARMKLGTLFHVYDLRLADAHLPSGETESRLREIGLDSKLPFVLQGRDLLMSLVNALYALVQSVENVPSK